MYKEIKDFIKTAKDISEEWVFKYGRSRIIGPWYIHWYLVFRSFNRKVNNGEEAMVSPLRA